MSDFESEVGRVLVELINILDKIGVISKIRLIDQIGVEDIVVIKESKRYNYSKIAEYLKYNPVFIPIDRKRAVYAQKRLKEILGTEVFKKPTRLGYIYGYLFFT